MIPLALALFISQAIHPPEAIQDPCRSCELISKAATALSEGDSVKFMGYFDKGMPGFADLELHVNALAAQQDIAASIDILKESAEGDQVEALCDFFLQLTSQDGNFVVTRRRERVTIVEKRVKKNWRIVSLSPTSILAPVTPR